MKKSIVAISIAATLLSGTADAEWKSHSYADEMTGDKSAIAYSDDVGPSRPMGFPYGDLTAYLAFKCDSAGEYVYVAFSESPNISNTETKDGYSTFSTRVKWDDDLETYYFLQTWGSEVIQFSDDQWAISKIQSANKLLLEVKWYGEGSTYWSFPLSGSSEAIAKARAAC